MANILKFRTIFHTFWASILLFMQLFLKMFIGMANNVDPNQTTAAPSGAVRSVSAAFLACAILSENLEYEILGQSLSFLLI